MIHELGTIIKVKLSDSSTSAASSMSLDQPSAPYVQPAHQQGPA